MLRNAPDGLQTLATAEAAVGGRAFDRERLGVGASRSGPRVVKHLAKSFKKKTGAKPCKPRKGRDTVLKGYKRPFKG